MITNSQAKDAYLWHDLMSDEWKDAPQALEHVLSYNDNIDHNIFLGKRRTREIFWVQLQPFLYSRGYNLRPRYHPDWLPSWRNHTKPIQTLDEFEDSLAHIGTFMDATRLSDGSKVVIKLVQTWRKEIPIAQYLSSPEAMSDPRNHTIPVFDILPLPNDDSEALMIMPQVLHFNPPGLPFTRLGEFHEAVKQYIEGLEFMHQHRISHR
ncbi:hypothetical protein D9615_003107 [Tricholomella constricta]|uniref:Protein kinase domain-containing protein n=1 Tax=Tricholomella constricta TaxID=117010 RepID=A0A8H5M7Z0_9AGAR|nr:hypothetical protein D9615_003107 [Tricholomella constricta]